MRCAVLLNDTGLLEELLREEHVMDVMGALEHDPETPAGARVQHRKFLQVGRAAMGRVAADAAVAAFGACRGGMWRMGQLPLAAAGKGQMSGRRPLKSPSLGTTLPAGVCGVQAGGPH